MQSSPNPKLALDGSQKRPESSFSLTTPTVLGQWSLVAPIAMGTHAEVYLATPLDRGTQSSADYAIKVARPNVSREIAVPLLARHLAAASALSDPAIIPVLSADMNGTHPHLVMPYIRGGNLQQWRVKSTHQPLPVLLWIVRQLAQGLLSIHNLRWLHGDVQPANILISDTGHLFITDLAFSQSIDALDPEFGRGNRFYAAPERWSDRPELSQASDVYSLGIIFFELLTGNLPAGCGSDSQYTPEQLQKSANLFRDRHPNAPIAIEKVLGRLLSRHPARRPALEELVPVLMALEIETFGKHITPSSHFRGAA